LSAAICASASQIRNCGYTGGAIRVRQFSRALLRERGRPAPPAELWEAQDLMHLLHGGQPQWSVIFSGSDWRLSARIGAYRKDG
jgi:hypothetical protein